MATNPIKLVINRQTKALVAFNGSASALSPQFQSNTVDFEISAVDPAASITTTPPFNLVDLAAFGLRVAVGPPPTGTAGGPTTLALSTNGAWDATNKKFAGSIALNTVGVDGYIGALAEKSAYFEVNLTFGTDRITLYQGPILIKAVVDELLSLVPTPVETYLTSNESKSLFARKVGLPGERIVLWSENSAYFREIGVNNDGTDLNNSGTA